MNTRICTAITLLLTLFTACIASEKIVVSTESWIGATEADGSGLYFDILRAVYEPEGYQIDIDIRSYEGSVNRTQQKDCDLMIGAYEGEIENVRYPTLPFAVDVVQAVAKRNVVSPSTELDGNVWGWIKDYGYEAYLDAEIVNRIQAKEFANRDLLWKLLSLDKLDVIVDARADVEEYMESHADAYPSLRYHAQDLMELQLFFAFADTEKGEMLAKVYDEKIRQLIKSGEFEKLYQKYESQGFQIPSVLQSLSSK